MTALRLHALCVPFGSAPGLEGISLTIQQGERVVLVGPSGSGKTSLLRAIAGLAPAGRGRVEIGGSDRTGEPPERRDAVYLHQTPLLFPHLDVFENAAFPLRIRGVPTAEVKDLVARALAALHLHGLEARRPYELSGGQRHRVALARAMLARPKLLLLDEPLTGLDPALRDEIREAIAALHREYGPALLTVTHDLEEAVFSADRIAVLLDGQILQTARPSELFAAPATPDVARFLALGPEVPGYVDSSGAFDSPLGRYHVAGAVSEGPAIAFVRREAVRVDPTGSVPGAVEAVRHGPSGVVARVRTAAGVLEVAVHRAGAPRLGEPIRLSVLGDRLLVFPVK